MKLIKDVGINKPAKVPPSSETRRIPNNRFDALASKGTVSVESDKDLDTLIVGSNAAAQEQQQKNQKTVVIDDIKVITIDKMSRKKKNTTGDLKQLVEKCKKGNADITEVLKTHKPQPSTKYAKYKKL